MANGIIQPYLLKQLDTYRTNAIETFVNQVLTVEVADEQIEEKIYDEEQRLRVHRTILRKRIKQMAHEHYADFLNRELGAGHELGDVKESFQRMVLKELEKAGTRLAERAEHTGFAAFQQVIPRENWVPCLCRCAGVGVLSESKRDLETEGLPVHFSPLLERWGVIKVSVPPDEHALRALSKMPGIETLADPLSPVSIPRPTMVHPLSEDSRRMLKLAKEQSLKWGRGVTLAILDSGIDVKHPAFPNIEADDYRTFTEPHLRDECGHGTHCAGIAAGMGLNDNGQYMGIAPNCRLVMGKVLYGNGCGNLENILEGMAWAVYEKKADVISMSLGDDYTPANGRSLWSQACDQAAKDGVIVCVSAGNSGEKGLESVTVPADSAQAVAVGALDKAGILADFSSRGSEREDSALYGKPETAAPGVYIVSARSGDCEYPVYSGDPRLTCISGTSMAAPAVAGCFALLKSCALAGGWKPSPGELKEVLFQSCRPLMDPDGSPYSSAYAVGHGLVDMERAFALIRDRAVNVPDQPGAPADRGICSSCGSEYLSRVGVFNSEMVCPECGAPICSTCWHLGKRSCRKHEKIAGKGPVSNVAAFRPPAGEEKPPFFEVLGDHDSGYSAEHILGRFESKFMSHSRLRLAKGLEFVPGSARRSLYKREAGDILEFRFSKKLSGKTRLVVALVTLGNGAYTDSPDGPEPVANLLETVLGAHGLDINARFPACIGLYSPHGWPEKWRQHPPSSGKVQFMLVEPVINRNPSYWLIWGPEDGPVDLFDPETSEEKERRIRSGLRKLHERIGPVFNLNDVMSEFGLQRDRQKVLTLIRDDESLGIQLIERKDGRYLRPRQ